jgi:hypothetical protein
MPHLNVKNLSRIMRPCISSLAATILIGCTILRSRNESGHRSGTKELASIVIEESGDADGTRVVVTAMQGGEEAFTFSGMAFHIDFGIAGRPLSLLAAYGQ